MMETTPKTDPEVDTPKPRHWRRWLVFAAAVMTFMYLGYRIGFPIWIESTAQTDSATTTVAGAVFFVTAY